MESELTSLRYRGPRPVQGPVTAGGRHSLRAVPRTADALGQSGETTVASRDRDAGGVQSVARALDILETLADRGGEMAITDIASATGLPLPTIHRLLRTLVGRGYAHQTPRRRYALGSRLIPLGEMAGGSIGSIARPLLGTVVDRLDESASLAILDLDRVMYVAHVPSRRAMRMFTEVGRRAELHATGVGKALLSLMSDDQVLAMIERAGLAQKTPHTLTTPEALLAELGNIRQRGYALDQEEQEIGVVCVAVPVGGPVRLALSISGPTPRMTADAVAKAVPVLQDAARQLTQDLSDAGD